jgi:hypothetical protein
MEWSQPLAPTVHDSLEYCYCYLGDQFLSSMRFLVVLLALRLSSPFLLQICRNVLVVLSAQQLESTPILATWICASRSTSPGSLSTLPVSTVVCVASLPLAVTQACDMNSGCQAIHLKLSSVAANNAKKYKYVFPDDFKVYKRWRK